jgi:uncharacterized damage-inducible protein DinB
MKESDLNVRLARNRSAIGELITAVSGARNDSWAARPAPGKWTPAQHVSHIVLSYHAFIGDVRDGRPAHLIGSSRQRLVWRLFGLTQVLWLGRLPFGARAPREMRPPDAPPERSELFDDLHAAVHEFDAAARDAWRSAPRRRVLHPYFGPVSLSQAIRVCEVHTRHHAALLAQYSASSGGATKL